MNTKKFRDTYMTKEQYIDWLIQGIQMNAKHFIKAHYLELKMHFSELIAKNQMELIELGYTWISIHAPTRGATERLG